MSHCRNTCYGTLVVVFRFELKLEDIMPRTVRIRRPRKEDICSLTAFGELLQNIRVERVWEQQDVVGLLHQVQTFKGINQPVYSEWESGKRLPKAKFLLKI